MNDWDDVRMLDVPAGWAELDESGWGMLLAYDGTGNPSVLVTSTSYRAFAYTYDPYGIPTLTVDSGGNGTTQNPYTFKNGIQERTTGWIKYGARWYDPVTGRFTQQDSLNAPLDPANANRYAYAGGDPINNSDPRGLATLASSANALLGAVVSGFIGATIAATCVAAVIGFTGGIGILGAWVCGAVGASAGALITQDFRGPF